MNAHGPRQPSGSPLRFVLTLLAAVALATATTPRAAEPPAAGTNAPPAWLAKPLTLVDALNVALEHNGQLRMARSDLEATHGVVMQVRAIALPKLRASGSYQWSDQTEDLTIGPPINSSISFQRENQWSAGIQLVQSVFEGGRLRASLRTARLTREQAQDQYAAAVADTVLHVRTAFYNVLLAAQQIQVQQESLELLEAELKTARNREETGTVPHFNVLRAEVEVANARPPLIHARNNHRIARIQLTHLLGHDLPNHTWENIPLQLEGTLETPPRHIDLQAALQKAFERRPELAALRKAEAIGRENIAAARSGYLPSVQVFAGHGWRSSTFDKNLATDVSGWNAGAQLSWNLFDGMSTYGKLREARALQQKASIQVEETARAIALEVRTAYSGFIEATEVLESQQKATQTAEEALRLANVRAEAGAGIQLDVLNARTALTQARTTRIVAQRDYLTALARLERAVGIDATQGPAVILEPKQPPQTR